MKKTPSKPSPAAEKIDIIKLHKEDYVAPAKPVLIDVKPARYLAVEGCGKPGGPVFEARIGALYAMAYTLKMTRKFAGKGEYTVSKLECIYENLLDEPVPAMDQWRWKMLIRTPEFISASDLSEALAALSKRGREGDAGHVHLETINEGTCVQLLHVGPYDKECESVAKMEAFARSKGLKLTGKHHEIYISDPRRVEPARLKTILRVPAN